LLLQFNFGAKGVKFRYHTIASCGNGNWILECEDS